MITFTNYDKFEKSLVEILKDLEKQADSIIGKNSKDVYSTDYNIYEENGYKHYEFMLPEFEKEDIKVELNHKNEIIVTTSKKKNNRQYIERNVKSTKMFKIQLNSELVNDYIKTIFKDGVLTLSFKAQNNPKFIKID